MAEDITEEPYRDPREFASFDGTRLAYYDHGDGVAPVILLHGLLSEASHLAGLARLLRERGMRPIALDFRAHGKSDAPRDPEDRNQAIARDVVELGRHLDLAEYRWWGTAWARK